jgi:hypothetical protein
MCVGCREKRLGELGEEVVGRIADGEVTVRVAE